jgi:hypothetical protein
MHLAHWQTTCLLAVGVAAFGTTQQTGPLTPQLGDAQGGGPALRHPAPPPAQGPGVLGAEALDGNGGHLLYASVNDMPVSETVYLVKQSTGQAVPLGPSGVSSPLDLASDWRLDSFRVWAVNTSTNQLISIDRHTGAGTPVGNFGSSVSMESLAFDVTTGRMFGSTNDDRLFEIDPSTAASTFVGAIGFGSVFGLAFDGQGTLYGVSDSSDTFIRIDTTTGAGTSIGTVNAPAITDIAFRPLDGVLFGCDTPTDSIYTIDPSSGEATLVGPYGAGINYMVGLAFSPTLANVDFDPGLIQPASNGSSVTGASIGSYAQIRSAGVNLGATIFDTTVGGANATGAHPQLLVGHGNALVLQDIRFPEQSSGGSFLSPSPAPEGGRMIFDFAGRTEPLNMALIGSSQARVQLVDDEGRERTYLVPAGWSPPLSAATLELWTLAPQSGFSAVATASEDPGFRARRVVRLEVQLAGPAAVDELLFFVE